MPHRLPESKRAIMRTQGALFMDLARRAQAAGEMTPIASELALSHVNFGSAEFVAWLPGDLTCDGVVNGFDIDAFVSALDGAMAYDAAYPDCDRELADIKCDGSVNGFDSDPFVALLSG